jgi:hypothetical protein
VEVPERDVIQRDQRGELVAVDRLPFSDPEAGAVLDGLALVEPPEELHDGVVDLTDGDVVRDLNGEVRHKRRMHPSPQDRDVERVLDPLGEVLGHPVERTGPNREANDLDLSLAQQRDQVLDLALLRPRKVIVDPVLKVDLGDTKACLTQRRRNVSYTVVFKCVQTDDCDA